MAKAETVVSPFGVLQYPWLTTEDPTYGKYKTQIKLTGAETKDLKKLAEAFVKENFKGKKIKGMPFKDHADLGEVFYASSKYAPVLVGPKNAPLDLDGKYVGSGSTARIMGSFAIANDFCVFQLRKVQIKNLVLGGGGEDFPDDVEDESEEDDVTSDEVDGLDI